MKISIITATYNSALTISDCIASVNNQIYSDIEHIIIDGASTDNTIEIINSQPNRVKKIISEPDHGIYDAMNKGLKLAKADIIGILNSDDMYIDCNVISQVVNVFENFECDSLFGDLFYVRNENPDIIVRSWHTKQFKEGSFSKGWHPPHPTFFVRREVYAKYGLFDLQFRLAADFELMLRFLEKHKIKNVYIQKPLIKMRLGGATNKNLKNILDQNIECYKAFRKNSIPVSIFYPVIRLTPKLLQFFIK